MGALLSYIQDRQLVQPSKRIHRSFPADCVLCLTNCHADTQPISVTTCRTCKALKNPNWHMMKRHCSAGIPSSHGIMTVATIYSLYWQIVCWSAAPVLHATFVCMAFCAISACPAVAELYLQACPGQVDTENTASLASVVTHYLQIRRRSRSICVP